MKLYWNFLPCLVLLFSGIVGRASLEAQSLETALQQTSLKALVAEAKELGDAARGAVVFHQPQMACSKCHIIGNHGKSDEPLLGPDLTKLDPATTDESLVESVIYPSKIIRKGYESVKIVTTDGNILSALLVEQTREKVVVRDISRGGEQLTFQMEDVEELKPNELSLMPAGQVNQLNSRQQFLDLIRYLIEIRNGGRARALELQPAPSLLTLAVPEYESHLDHEGLIKSWGEESLKRGAAIYQRVCANCHGTKDQPGSLPTSLRFAEGKFKNGNDPLSMYRTLTHGFGLMAPQTWMVPSQKYDVIHYIREVYLKPNNGSQYAAVDSNYFAKLPKGVTFGPEPSKIEAWSAMDYGPSLAHTFEVPGAMSNFAYKGVAVRLDPGAGGVSRGRHWMVFDTDTLRTAAAWSANGAVSVPKALANEKDGVSESNFIDWKGIQFNGEHGIHPKIVGKKAYTNATGPGWADPMKGNFSDDQRVLGRDGKRYGPLPRSWGRYKGLYHYGNQVIFSYTVGKTEILESPRLLTRDGTNLSPLMLRMFQVGPRDRDLLLQVAEYPMRDASMSNLNVEDKSIVQVDSSKRETESLEKQKEFFDGKSYLQIADGKSFDVTSRDFSIVARIRTTSDGTIWSISEGGPKWNPDGESFFIRNGRLCFDIGWVGAVSAKTKVSDGQWHNIVLTWEHSSKTVRIYVDGKLDGEGPLSAKQAMRESVVRIGFTAPNFPQPSSFFSGEISQVQFYQKRLSDTGLTLPIPKSEESALVADWRPSEISGLKLSDASGHRHDAEVHHGAEPVTSVPQSLLAGFIPRTLGAEWISVDGNLRLRIPAGQESLRFAIWVPAAVDVESEVEAIRAGEVGRLSSLTIPEGDFDLASLIRGGPPRWPQTMITNAIAGNEDGPFAADILTVPESNPWLAQVRLTGLDFYEDGRMAVCSWDGDVWIVQPSTTPSDPSLRWQRIATGLFQPLGLKIKNGKIHVTCRDQLAVLHDLNQDGEIDFYECLNNDHQVTEHFHEFAMGLQTDAEGNFYYAKSGCHGKAAIVPHHGTLLRVSADGSTTEILANGFRAANGVCLNPDGTFFVTDQEGFWNPKNRINHVTLGQNGKPNFYGNMLGYHDVTDPSDSAMVPPLCWITNEFDRSPAELLWVDSERWGPLRGSLLNLSYGYGKVFLVPHEKIGGKLQGGMIELPIPTFPTGVMRGRFHPTDGHLYLCGMFAWAGNATQPGGLYRLRATGKPVQLPIGLRASKSGLQLTFTEPLDPESIDLQQLRIRTWSLKRTEKYGSKHLDERSMQVQQATLSEDRKTLSLAVSEIAPTWCMEIKYVFRSATGADVRGTIHNTIHELSP